MVQKVSTKGGKWWKVWFVITLRTATVWQQNGQTLYRMGLHWMESSINKMKTTTYN